MSANSGGEPLASSDFNAAANAETSDADVGIEGQDSSDPAPHISQSQTEISQSGLVQPRRIEDATVAELVAQLSRSPLQTWRLLKAAASSQGRRSDLILAPQPVGFADGPQAFRAIHINWRERIGPQKAIQIGQLLLYALALSVAFVGSVIARGTAEIPRFAETSLHVAAPFLWLGFLLWLAAEIVGRAPRIRAYWRECDRLARMRWFARVIPALFILAGLHRFLQSMGAPREYAINLAGSALGLVLSGLILLIALEQASRHLQRSPKTRIGRRLIQSQPSEQTWIVNRSPSPGHALRKASRWRAAALILAVMCSAYVWANTSGNRIETTAIGVWLLSIGCWSLAFAPYRWDAFDWAAHRIDAWRRLDLRGNRWAIALFATILLLGMSLRLPNLESSPPQLISDHVENIKDAYDIRYNEYRPLLFTNYNSREPLHYYLLVMLSAAPGLEVDRYAFSLLSAIEGIITLSFLFWLALEIIGERPKRIRLAYAIAATALAAVSIWHLTISRQGFRVALCPLFVASSLIFFVRALRYNRRTDYVKSGLLLGFGLLSYQPLQMLPAIYVIGVAIALSVRRRMWRIQLRYWLNLGVLAFCAFIVFLPLFHLWVEQPDAALSRQLSGIFGATPMNAGQRLEFLRDNAATLLSNLRANLLMFHYYGDSVWISGLPDEPATDPLTASFILLGLAAWIAMIFTSRDPAFMLVPIALFCMLLVPSLALAHPIESLHNMRASGAIVPVFLIAGLPLAVFCHRLVAAFPKRIGILLAVAVTASAILYTYNYNSEMYFGRYRDRYLRAAQPHAQAGSILRSFAESDGSYGNAFVLPYPHWWDSRAVGMEGGKPGWFNDPLPSAIPSYLGRALTRSDDLRLDPERDLLFFYSQNDEEAAELLKAYFPQGRAIKHRLEMESKSFYTYRVLALGRDGLLEFIHANA